ncbi:MAG: BON domain-containing protein [bacterium]|nr:BON domain-containing protein [bacterium]
MAILKAEAQRDDTPTDKQGIVSDSQRTGLDPMIDSGFRDVTGRIRHLLDESPIAEVRRIQVERHGDQVFLQGRVRSFYAKQMAQETIRRAAGDLQIVNSVSVDEL